MKQRRSLSKQRKEAEKFAREGNRERAVDVMLTASEHAWRHVGPHAGFEILQQLERLVPVADLDSRQYARILTVRGSILGEMGRLGEAQQELETAFEMSESNEDNQLRGNVAFNLGINAHERGDYEQARHMLATSLRLRAESDDVFGAFQVMLALGALAVDSGDLESGAEIFGQLAGLVRFVRDPGTLCSFHGMCGSLEVGRRQFAEAETEFRLALKYARKACDVIDEPKTLLNLGNVRTELGRTRGALWAYRRGAAIARQTGQPLMAAYLHHGLGLVLEQQGKTKEAIPEWQRARRLYRRLGRMEDADHLGINQGAALSRIGRLGPAMRILREAAIGSAERGDWEGQAWALVYRAAISQQKGSLRTAQGYLLDALDVLPEGARVERAEIFKRMGRLELVGGEDAGGAARYFHQAVSEIEKVNKKQMAWEALIAGAELAQSAEQREALDFYSQAVAIYEDLSDRQMLFHATNDYGIALMELGDLDEANEQFQHALTLGTSVIRDRAMILQARLNMAELARRRGDIRRSIGLNRQALRLARNSADARSEVDICNNLALALMDDGRIAEAREYYMSARALAAATRHDAGVADAETGLARIYFLEGRYSDAARHFRDARRVALRGKAGADAVTSQAGLVEALAAARKTRALGAEAQRLADMAYEYGGNDRAAGGLARSARWYFSRRQDEEAFALYAISVVLGMSERGLEGQALAVAAGKSFLQILISAKLERAIDEKLFMERVLSEMDKKYGGIGGQVRSLADLAVETVKGMHIDMEPLMAAKGSSGHLAEVK